MGGGRLRLRLYWTDLKTTSGTALIREAATVKRETEGAIQQ
jgi:hypothetical protein